jgi:NitT/TauT family transport system substrate-binding protein
MLKKRIFAAFLAASSALMFTACGSNTAASTTTDTQAAASSATVSETTSSAETESSELTTVRLAIMTNECSQWYALVGDETGIFAEHGLEVQITEFAAGINTIDAVVTEQADVGNLADYAAINRIGNTQDTSNLRILGRYSSGSTGKLYVSDDITSLADLADAPVATQPGTVWDYWTAKAYEEAGIDADHQNIVECDSAATAVALMTTGQASAFWASGTNAKKLEDSGFGSLISMSDLNLTVDGYFVTTSTFLEEQPETAEALVAALQDIADYMIANPEETAQILEERAQIPQEQTLTNLEAYSLAMDFPQSTLDHLNDIKAWAVEQGKFADYELTDFIDLSALKSAVPDAEVID